MSQIQGDVASIYLNYVVKLEGILKSSHDRNYILKKSSQQKYKKSTVHTLPGYQLEIFQKGKYGDFEKTYHFISGLKEIPFIKGQQVHLFVLLYQLQNKNTFIQFPNVRSYTSSIGDFIIPSQKIINDSSELLTKRRFSNKKEDAVFGLILGRTKYVSDFPFLLPELTCGRNNVSQIYQTLLEKKLK